MYRSVGDIGRGDSTVGGQNVRAILAAEVSWWAVVANSEEWGDTRSSVGQALARAVLDSAPNADSVLPDNLRVVSPLLEVAHVGLNAVWQGVEIDLSVVHLVGDHGWDVGGRCASANVLAIATTTGLGVVCIDA